MNIFKFGNHEISQSSPPFLIAEVSANHNGSIERAKSIIKLAKDSGADAVKIQTYEPDTLTLNCTKPEFIIKEGLWKGRSLYDLYSEAFTPFSWHAELFRFSREIGVTLFSSPFDESAVDLLESLDVPAYKIASFELCDLPLIDKVAKTGKPILMSTGLSSLHEIDDAVNTATKYGDRDIVLFHCVSSYPATIADSCLSNITVLQKRYNINIGLSDHTICNTASIVSTALGVTVIEKHFTDSREHGGVDSTFSLEPSELRLLKNDITNAWKSICVKEFTRPSSENANIKFKRSLYFNKDICVGDVIDETCVRCVRPGYGLLPKYLNQILGKRLKVDVQFGDSVNWDCFH